MKHTHTPIMIIGAGPVGLATAAMLRRHGLRVRIIDRNTGPTPYSKAVGMHARTLEAMHALSLTEQLIADGRPLHRFRLQEDGGTIMSAGFASTGSAYPFVLGLPQRCTENRLLARLQSQGCDVEWRTSLLNLRKTGDTQDPNASAEVVLQHADGTQECVSCNWLIGCDGGRSVVREQAGIAFQGGDYGNAFILGDARIDWAGPRDELQFFLSAKGYLLLVPMPDGLHRIIAQTEHRYEDFQGHDRPQATLEELQAIVDRNGPGGIRVHSPQWLTSAPFYHRLAETPVKGRIVLAGDAFHLFSPLGAQGLNTGFQDSFNLAWKLAFIEKGWAPVKLIDTYRQEREAMARLIGNVTTRTTRYITATQPMTRLARRIGTRLLNNTPRVQERLPRLLAGMLQSYGRASGLTGASGLDTVPVGGRVPHAWVADGQSHRPLASHLHGVAYTALLIAPRVTPTLLQSLQRFWTDATRRRLPFLQLQVLTREIDRMPEPLPAGVKLVHDLLGDADAAISQGTPSLLLVRPDGYCAMSVQGWDLAAVDFYFAQRHLGAPLDSAPASSATKTEMGHAA
jgi:2-polyprenyl-6-methoxyphenol hydroxylase-like FAD-dependent oxidoreductase